jgi:hypothetical protein
LREIELLVEAYLFAERALVAAVDAAGDTVPLPDGGAARSSIAPLGSAAMRGVVFRKQARMPDAAMTAPTVSAAFLADDHRVAST